MAGRISVSAVQGDEGSYCSCNLVSVLRLPASDLSYSGNHFPGHSEAAGHVVPGDVVCDQSEERGQRAGVATVEVSSEDPSFPIESVFGPNEGPGWRASKGGEQQI